MALKIGERLGPYEVVGAIGAGSMGDVYRARDTKLGRDVAIKVLPELFADDQERLARFEREAKTLASLNHPNIAQVHGVLEDPPALVMELVEGEDLQHRLERGAMPLEDAIHAARQIAEALEAAHESGIIHRDLKPANIRVRPDGTIKVLDFGLAKTLDAATVSGIHPTQSPTLTAHSTQFGTIIGTAAYMAPEQARGKAVDRRGDIWAFGCVLYELLTATRAFGCDDVTDTLTAVLRDTPDWTRLPPETPASLRALLLRCLEKDPRQRLRDIGEARVLLGDPQITTRPAATASADGGGASGRRRATRVATTMVVAALAAFAGYVARPAPTEGLLRKSRISVQADEGGLRSPVISPDGRSVAYIARSRIWVQAIDSWEPRELGGTEGGTRPFWSPAGDWIVFFRSEQLLKVPAAGGPVVTVARLPAVQAPLNSASGVWTVDGTLIISMAAGPVLYSVSSRGGELKTHFKLPGEIGQDLLDLDLMPKGAILATVRRAGDTDALGVLSKGTFTILLEASDVGQPRYSPSGHIVFEREAPDPGLWALPFSADRLEVSGEAFLVARGDGPSLSRDGTLVYRGEGEELDRQLAWFTMDGVPREIIAAPQDWQEGVALSADRRRLLASTSDGIWVYDVGTGGRERLTTGKTDITPRWVGSGGDIVFVRTKDGRPNLVTKRAGAASEERVLATNARFPSVTADGKRIVFNERVAEQPQWQWQVAWIDLDRPSAIRRLGAPHVGARFPAVSSDGQFVTYVSGEIGRDEVFLTRLPGGQGKAQVSTNGGGWTRFSGRGDAVIYRTSAGDLMSAPFKLDGELSVGRPQRLFEWGAGWLPFYDLAPDGMRGIGAMPVGKTTRISSLSLVQNWQLEFIGR